MPDFTASLLRVVLIGMAFLASAAQAQSSPDAREIQIVYMGGIDCPPCRVWRGTELPKLEATKTYKRIKVHVRHEDHQFLRSADHLPASRCETIQ